MNTIRYTLALALTLTACFAHAQAPTMNFEVVAAKEAFASGDAAQLAMRFSLPESWHVQANNPNDPYLIPTTIQFNELPEGITLTRVAYPEAKEYSLQFSADKLLAYPHEFTIGAELSIDDGVAPDNYPLSATLRYQACDDTQCLAPVNLDVPVELVVADAAGSDQHQEVFAAINWPETEAIEWLDFTSDQGPSFKMAVVTDHTAIRPGGVVHGIIRVQLDKPWHMNAHKPLDPYLIPTVVELSALPEGAGVPAFAYPEPHMITFDFQPDPMAVYEEEFDIAFRLPIGEDTTPGDFTIEGKLNYQACDDKACYRPSSAPFTFGLSIAGSGEPPVKSDAVLLADVDVSKFDFGEAVAIEPTEDPTPKVTEVEDDNWESLIDEFTVAGQASGYMGSDEFISFIDETEAGRGNEVQSLDSYSFAGVMVLAIVAGLLLNLTPCVLPLIPINLAIIGAGAKAESRTRGIVLGGAYGVGIAAVFGLLGLLFVLGIASFGGSLNENPWFNLGITVLFVMLALAMFDVFMIDFSKLQSKINTQGKGGHVGFAAFMGAVSALLAGACVAPALVAVLLYSQAQYVAGNTVALILPLLVGVGMAIPWPVVGGGISMLPKPGAWMDKVKYGFGVVILIIGAYYGYQTYKMFDSKMVDESAVIASADESGWHKHLGPALAEAKAEGKPVLIDFWATWCKNCLVMNETTFKDEAVLTKLDGYVKVKYQAENPGESPHAELLDRFDQYVSFPFYAVIQPK